jgi:hypothetical protein
LTYETRLALVTKAVLKLVIASKAGKPRFSKVTASKWPGAERDAFTVIGNGKASFNNDEMKSLCRKYMLELRVE